jgi:large subunit ribosomal protein L4
MTAFYRKLADSEVVVIDNFAIEKPKTKEMKEILKKLGLNGKSILIVLPEKDNSIVLSARNIPSVSVTRSADLNIYDVIAYNVLLMTKDAAIRIEDIKGS